MDPELEVPTLVPSMILETGVTSLSVVASDDSSILTVLLELGCEVLPGAELIPTRSVVSSPTGVLRENEVSVVEGRVPKTVEECGEGESMTDERTKEEGLWVLTTDEDKGSVCDIPSDTLLKIVDISEGVIP